MLLKHLRICSFLQLLLLGLLHSHWGSHLLSALHLQHSRPHVISVVT